jgi:hypothetical protein
VVVGDHARSGSTVAITPTAARKQSQIALIDFMSSAPLLLQVHREDSNPALDHKPSET